jgi:hypothetical protein
MTMMLYQRPIEESGVRIREGKPMTVIGKDTAVFGIYPHRLSCEHAFSAFKNGGFQDSEISVFFRKNPNPDSRGKEKMNSDLERAANPAASGVVIGGTLGWLAGTSTVDVPGLEKLFIAGPTASTLAEIADGETLDGVALALSALGVPENEARKYEARIENGEILMAAHCATPTSASRARRLFVSTGAEDVCSLGDSSADEVGA